MTFRTLVFAYLAGGLTFLPLLFVTIIAVGWYLLPKIDGVKSGEPADEDESAAGSSQAEELSGTADKAKKRQESFGETAASGTFAVLRQYDYQAAMTALNARNNASAGANGSAVSDGNATGEGGSGATSESVYQSMYRSVFAANRNSNSTSLLHGDDTEQNPGARRKAMPANVMHIILRHGHLMLYDSPAHVDVKYVISLAHHDISLQADKDGDDADETKILEPDLFTKRTAIVLTLADLPNGAKQQPNPQKGAKPFYLFCATNIDKEDFYRALLYTRAHPPTPRPLDTDALIKLQSALHSSLLTPETRALNALVGRIFLGVHKTDRLIEFIRGKIERKIGRIQKPSFIPIVQVRSIDLGDAAPVYSNLKLRDLNVSGDMTISADVRYNGGLSITLLAVAKLDLGSRFKTRTVDLVLKTSIHRIAGTMLHHVKSAPTNRMWFCFESMPEIEVRVEPVVSERKITYGFVLRAIEEKVRAAFAEGLVKPNWDDVPMPLQDTRGSHARGGVWLNDGDQELAQHRSDDFGITTDRNEKTASMPDLVRDDTGSSTALSSNSEIHLTKIRHSSTMPVDVRSHKRHASASTNDIGSSSVRGPLPPKPLRSHSITSTSPSVAMDEHTVDASLRLAPSQRKLWGSLGTPAPATQQKDALEGLRDLRARAEQAAGRASGSVGSGDETPAVQYESAVGLEDVGDTSSMNSRQLSVGSDSTIPVTPPPLSARSTGSEQSAAANSLASSTKAEQLQQKKANILAAAGAATNAAKNWGWNAYQKNKGVFQRGGAVPSEPIGRGQPLPPPGQPLPGPNKGLWGNMGAMRRKPALSLSSTSRQTSIGASEAAKQAAQRSTSSAQRVRSRSMTEDEFGNWHENNGDFDDDALAEHPAPNRSQEGLAKPPRAVLAGEVTRSASTGDSQPEHEDSTSEVGPESADMTTNEQTKPKKLPPPLPVRQGVNAAEVAASVATSRSTDRLEGPAIPENEHHTEKSEPSALPVPDSVAEAIAAENATPGLARGVTDDEAHVDEARAIQTEVLPDRGYRDQSQEDQAVQKDVALHELERTPTEERFARGEDVTEEDFEGHTAR